VTASSPLIIGATGGSGTRVLARIAQRAGYDLGHYINEANDALAFRSFHDRWINRFLQAKKRNQALTTNDREPMENDFRRALNSHRGSGVASHPQWGWKAPRSIYLLSFLRAQFADLKFIHVLRDGRDMAFSKNQNQLRKHGSRVLSWNERLLNPEPVRSILLWSRINLQAAEFGEKHLGRNYCLVRFEDLCQNPVETTSSVLRFLHAEVDPVSIANSEILAPSSIGRWREHSPRVISKMTVAGENALRRFGYL
jgi:hypothetical protein